MEKYVINENNHFFFNPNAISLETLEAVIKASREDRVEATPNKATSLAELRDSFRTKDGKLNFNGIELNENAAPREVFEEVFKDLENDPTVGTGVLTEYFREYEEIQYDTAVSKAKEHFTFAQQKSYISTMNPFNVDIGDPSVELENENRERYDERCIGDQVSIYVGDSLILQYEKGKLADSVATAFSDIVKWAVVMFDVFNVVSTIAGIWAPKCDTGKINKFTKFLSKCWSKFKYVISEFQTMLVHQSWYTKAKRVVVALMACMKVGVPIKDMVKAFFAGAKWWQYLFYVGSLIANITLLCISSGSSLVLKMAKLTAQLVILVKDVMKALGKLNLERTPQLEYS